MAAAMAMARRAVVRAVAAGEAVPTTAAAREPAETAAAAKGSRRRRHNTTAKQGASGASAGHVWFETRGASGWPAAVLQCGCDVQ